MTNQELFDKISTILQDESVEKIEVTKGRINGDEIVLTIKCFKTSFETEIGFSKKETIVEQEVVVADALSERVIKALLEKKNVFAELSLSKEDKYEILSRYGLQPSDYYEQFWK